MLLLKEMYKKVKKENIFNHNGFMIQLINQNC